MLDTSRKMFSSPASWRVGKSPGDMPAMFLRRQIARYISRSIGSEERNAVAVRGEGGIGRPPCLFIIVSTAVGLKGRQKPTSASDEKAVLVPVARSASTIVSSSPRIISRGFLRSLFSTSLSLSLSLTICDFLFFLYMRLLSLLLPFQSGFRGIVVYSSISEWRRESEWNARRKDQPVDCRSTQTIVKSRERQAHGVTETYVPRITS